jgi:WD40 repeat protein
LTTNDLSEEVGKKMDYLDFEVEIGVGSGRAYPVTVVRSASGEARETMHFPFDELALENRLKDLQIALLRSGGKRRQMLLPEEQTVRNFGRTLFNALFTGEVGKRYAVSQLAASNQGKGLRLKLRILSPELAALPWEFLYDPDGSDYICLSSMTPIVRYLELAQPPRPLLVTPPLSILAMTSSPKDLPELDIEREKQRLEKAIADLLAKGLVELTWLPGQTWYHLQREMRRGPWHILHFIGHGGFDARTDEGLIALEDEEGKAQMLTATHLGRLLADHRSLRLVVLNACEGARGSEQDIFSSTATILVRRGIPAVLAMQYEITDRAAIELSRVFYEALADGLPVDTAVGEARKAISFGIANTLEWGTPVLYMRSPDGMLFEMKQKPSRSRKPPDRPATKQVPSLNAVAPSETHRSELPQDEVSSQISGEMSKQARQTEDETSSTAQASRQSDSPHPARMEAISASTTPASGAIPPVIEQCQACGAKLPPGGAFCPQCGHQLQQAAYPPQISSSLPQTSSLGEEQASLHPMDRSARREADAASEVQAGEPVTAPTISTTKNKEYVLVNTLAGHSKMVRSVAISPDGQTLVSGSDDKTIKVWNLHSGELLKTLTGHLSSWFLGVSVVCVAISPDGQMLVSGAGDKTIKVWNLHSGELLKTLTGHSKTVNSVAISPNGQTLVSVSDDETIWVWNLHSGELLRTLTGHSKMVRSVAISPDGQTLVSVSNDKTIKLWNLHSGELLRTLTGHTSGVNSLAISLDGQTLVSGSSDNTIKIWNLSSGKKVRTLTGHTSDVNSVALSADGQTLVSGSDDKTIKVWNLHSGELLKTLTVTGHSSSSLLVVLSVAISPDGQTLVSVSDDLGVEQEVGDVLLYTEPHVTIHQLPS